MSKFIDDLQKVNLRQNPNGTVVIPSKTELNAKRSAMTQAQRDILIKDRYIILASGDKGHRLRLYYNDKGVIGTTDYPAPSVPEDALEFKFLQIVSLRNYLGMMPFGSRLVRNMEESVISVETFRKVWRDYFNKK